VALFEAFDMIKPGEDIHQLMGGGVSALHVASF
jgi:hypothetical protein